MRISHFAFGVVEIDGITYEHDVVIDNGEVQKRKKKASKKFRDAFGHTPLSLNELNSLGRDGWELVGTVPLLNTVQLYLKRARD